MINTNLPPILYRLRYIAFEWSKIAIFGYPSCVWLPPTEGFPWAISVKFSVDVNDGQGTKWRRNVAENFNRLSTAHERYRRQTDRRQTDGRATAYRLANSFVYSMNVLSINRFLCYWFFSETTQTCRSSTASRLNGQLLLLLFSGCLLWLVYRLLNPWNRTISRLPGVYT